jgi:thioredoxin 1
MEDYMIFGLSQRPHGPLLIIGCWLAVAIACSDAPTQAPSVSGTRHSIRPVSDADHFRDIVHNAGSRLLVFDFYADWCQPCRVLTPILESLAEKYNGRASFFKVDVDRNQELASAVGMQGIPYVLFVKDGATIHSLVGVHARETYAQLIRRFATTDSGQVPPRSREGGIANGGGTDHGSLLAGSTPP